MAISPPSDIVLGALRAADPEVRAAKAAELRSMAGEQASAAPRLQPRGLPFDAAVDQVARANMQVIHPTAGPARQQFRQFEAAVLQTAVSEMLPREGSESFGQGTAGSINRSWMAKAVADQISDAGGVGIAQTLQARYHPDTGSIAGPESGDDIRGAGGPEPVNADPGRSPGSASLLSMLDRVLSVLFTGPANDKPLEDRIRISR